MTEQFANTRAERPSIAVEEVSSVVDCWRIPVYVPDEGLRLMLASAARGTDYDITDEAGPLAIEADERGRLSVDDGNGTRRPVVLAKAGRMATRDDVAAAAAVAAGLVGAVGALVDVDRLGFVDDADDETEPTEAQCRSCEYVVALGAQCVVCGDANPHGPAIDPAEPTLFDAPRLPELV